MHPKNPRPPVDTIACLRAALFAPCHPFKLGSTHLLSVVPCPMTHAFPLPSTAPVSYDKCIAASAARRRLVPAPLHRDFVSRCQSACHNSRQRGLPRVPAQVFPMHVSSASTNVEAAMREKRRNGGGARFGGKTTGAGGCSRGAVAAAAASAWEHHSCHSSALSASPV